MSQADPALNTELLAMRREFDLGFTRVAHAQGVTPQHYLGLRFGDDAYAIPVTEITALHVDRRITPLPSHVPGLLGVVGLRGLIAPVYDLGNMLGYARRSASRWIVLVRGVEPVGFAFDQFEAHFSAAPDCIFPAHQLFAALPEGARAHLYDAVRTGDLIRPIIRMQSLLEPLQSHNSPSRHRSQTS